MKPPWTFHTSQQLSLTKCPSADPVKQKQPAAQPGQIPNPQPMSCNYVTMTRFWPLRLERTTITHCLGKEPSRSTNLIKITGSSRGPAPRPREGCAQGACGLPQAASWPPLAPLRPEKARLEPVYTTKWHQEARSATT